MQKFRFGVVTSRRRNSFFDDYPEAFIPQQWALESIATLTETMVIGNLVHRDFSPLVANYGEVINVTKPGGFKAKRKEAADNVTVQQPTATTFDVRLNQHLHTSFIIKDSDYSKARDDLFAEYLQPAVVSIAHAVDVIIAAQVHQFYKNSGGHLGMIDETNGDDYLLEAREAMNDNKVSDAGRYGLLTSKTESAMLRQDKFTSADKIGDDGTALRNASLGRLFGFNLVRLFNEPYVTGGLVTVNGAVNNAPSGYAPGTTTIAVDALTAAITPGTFITIAGDDTPLQVVSTVGGATPTSITVLNGIKHTVADNAIVKVQPKGVVSYAAGYPVNYSKTIAIGALPWTPRVGQAITFGTDNLNVYAIIDLEDPTHIILDRPLEVAVPDATAVNFGPSGSYNLMFVRDAIALVNRPLATPMAGTGARAAVVNYGGTSMRVVFTYDGNKQGTLVTVDTLMGVKVLDVDRGAIMFG